MSAHSLLLRPLEMLICPALLASPEIGGVPPALDANDDGRDACAAHWVC